MKLFLAGLLAENNSYSPIPTGLGAFEAEGIRRGPDSGVDPGGYLSAIETVRGVASRQGWEVVEGLFAAAVPLGPIRQPVYEQLRDVLLNDLRASMPVQAVMLMLHGAMTAEDCLDCEGDLIERARSIVGPEVPIGIELDLHAHVTQRMTRHATLMVAYKAYPHTDIDERAAEVAQLTLDTAEGRIRPVTAVWDCRMAGSWPTTREPLKSFVRELQALEGRNGVLSVSHAHGFAFWDVPEAGARLWVITDGDQPLAQQLAADLGRRLWGMRDELHQPPLRMTEAMRRVAELPPLAGTGPIVVADMADNPGGGARGDSSFALQAVRDLRIPNVALGGLWDPGAVQLCFEAGLGSTLGLRVAGKSGPTSGNPVDLRVTVRALAQEHAQTAFGSRSPLGASAWVSTSEGVDLVLISRCQQVIGTDLFTGLGIDLTRKHAVVVKSMQHFHAAFAPLASEVLYADSPGLLTADIAALPIQHRDPNFWPRVADPWSGSGP
jgi:microcystin degradation protein MlrC